MGRRFGQHFLARKSALDRIADAACQNSPPLVIEIGPGRGALTEPLLARAERVAAIEVDPVLVLYLRQKFRDAIESGKLTLIEGDILKADLDALGPSASVVGNLPYYITSPILERVFSMGSTWTRGVFLVQAEVASRIAAAPGSRDYGYLSVLVQAHARVERILEVPRDAFRPPPKVDSAVVMLMPHREGESPIADRESFLRFASACFRQKRKTLRNNLAGFYGKEVLDGLPEGRLRAEQLGIGELSALHRKLESIRTSQT